MNVDALDRVLKYLTDKEDLYGSATDPGAFHAHTVLAGKFEDEGDDAVAQRIMQEIKRSQEGNGNPDRVHQTIPNKFFTLYSIATHHPNPVVRALTAMQTNWAPKEPGQTPEASPDLLNFLFHSPDDNDHDLAVFLSPRDPVESHAAHPTAGDIHKKYGMSGLSTKVVRGRMYLLDSPVNENAKYGAPRILFHGSVSDPTEVQKLAEHADKIGSQRLGVARIGGPEFAAH